MKRRLGQHKGRTALFCALALVAFTMLTGVAFAEDPDPGDSKTAGTTATVNAGVLNVSNALVAGTFTGTLIGHAQSLQGSNAFTGFSINDPRGKGNGWTVVMKAAQFVNGDGISAHNIKLNSFTAPLFGVTAADSGSSGAPDTASAASIDNGTGVEMVTAGTAEGMGTYNFTAAATAWLLALTADEYAGTYTSTITTTLAAPVVGP